MIIVLSLLSVASGQGFCEDRLELDGARILGNRELSKMLHIIPWKAPPATDLDAYAVTPAVNEPLDELQPDDFGHELGYREALHERAPDR
jgi:hypothetical protein